ncbi:MAG: GIY-YIG nuclease family protein [Gemmatirosa sp.]|nr:GIY-YIG nuclease family protein [Gemmatirosa sp.]
MQPVVYIMASRCRGTLYVGVTSNLVRRAWQHRNDALPGFTRRYGVHMLVYYELHARMLDAIRREKQLKEWRRDWKIALIESTNPAWTNLWSTIARGEDGSRLSPG